MKNITIDNIKQLKPISNVILSNLKPFKSLSIKTNIMFATSKYIVRTSDTIEEFRTISSAIKRYNEIGNPNSINLSHLKIK